MALAAIDSMRERPIPGGWSQQRVHCGEHRWDLLLPRDADQFLDQLERPSEEQDEPDVYWSRLWPTAVTMSRLVSRAGWPMGARVLELGCGIGLVGLSALAAGWQVTFSDYIPLAVELAVANAKQNGFASASGLVLDWRQPVHQQFTGIIASDILYDLKQHVALVALLDRMLDRNGIAWFGDPGRYYTEHFVELAWERGYDVDVRNEKGEPVEVLTSGEFQLLEVRRRT